MKKVEVFYNGWGDSWKLGTLADNGKQVLFEYDVEALRQKLELSPLNLKLSAKTFSGFPHHQMQLPGLIFDSLPDGWGLLLMDKVFRKRGLKGSSISPLDRLSFVGENAVGALNYKPLFEEESQLASSLNLLGLAKEAQKVVLGKSSDALLELARLGGSPHGARPKVLVSYDTKKNQISNDGQTKDSFWLVKFQAANEHKEVCAIEALYSILAKKSGIEMTESHYFDLENNLSAFGVCRFDRENQYRVPVHTLAGVLNADFRLPSSVSYNSFLRTIRMMTKDESEVRKGFLQCVFNVIFNNRDDHPKNFSFRLNKNREWKLSPAYDLTFNEGPGGEHQMDIAGEGKNPSGSDLQSLAKDVGLAKKDCERTIGQVVDVANKFEVYSKDWPIRAATVSKIRNAIHTNLKNMRKIRK